MKDYFRSRKGSAVIWAPYLLLGLLLFAAAVWKLSSLHIIAEGNRDAVQKAVTQVCTDNVINVFTGVREGYSGGYKLVSTNWNSNVTGSDILGKLDSNLGTQDGTKMVDGKMQYSISDVSVNVQNAPLAPGSDNTQQFTATTTYTLTVPINSQWTVLPPLSLPQKVVSQYSPRGDAVGGGDPGDTGTPVDGLILSASDMTLDKGDTNVVAASITPDDAADRKINWTSTDAGVCAVTQTGAVTGVGVGSASVVALTDNGKMAQCNVTVVSPVAGISLDKSNIKMIKGAAETLTATVRPADATNKGVQWSTSDSSVCTVDQSGHIAAVGAGAATITVMTQEGGYFTECAVTVTIPVTGISLDKTSMTIAKGATDTLTATVWPGDATRHDVLWASSNSAVCPVDSAGHISAVGVGSAVISATTEDGQYTATCNINVVIPVTGITVNPTSLILLRYTSGQLIATVSPADATDKTLYWSSSNTAVCTVDGTGKVTGIGVGTATVSAKTRDGGYTATASITVKPNTYNVTVNSNYGGTGYGNGTYNAGSNVTLTEAPYQHYHFTGWTINGISVGTGSSYTIYNLTANVTVTANFAIDTFTVNVYGSTGGTASGSGTYAYGTVITLRAAASDWYEFIGWSDGALDNPRSYTVMQNVTITATFAAVDAQIYNLFAPNIMDSHGAINLPNTVVTSGNRDLFRIKLKAPLYYSPTNRIRIIIANLTTYCRTYPDSVINSAGQYNEALFSLDDYHTMRSFADSGLDGEHITTDGNPSRTITYQFYTIGISGSSDEFLVHMEDYEYANVPYPHTIGLSAPAGSITIGDKQLNNVQIFN